MNRYVDINPKICNGKPVIAGTRIPLTVLIDQLIAVQSIDGLLRKYPELTKEQICGALHYCHNLIEHSEFETSAA
jgi:uncharacterized protein (DUF433 family)